MLYRLSLLLPFTAAVALAGCDIGDAAKDVTSEVVATTIEATKGVADGVKDGVKEGRKGSESLDGARVLSTYEEISVATTLSVFEVRPSGGAVEVVLAVENITDAPVHLIGLSEDGGALLIDADGFSTPLLSRAITELRQAIVVPAHAKVKAPLRFEAADGTPTAIRVWGHELAVPARAATADAATSE